MRTGFLAGVAGFLADVFWFCRCDDLPEALAAGFGGGATGSGGGPNQVRLSSS